MDLKLKKKIENDKLYYLVADGANQDKYYEYYEYPNFKETPNIETICYKTIGSELMKAYKQKNFSPSGFKSILFLLHGIIIDNNVIDISTCKELSNVIDNIRYKDLYNVINSFRKKLSIEVLEYYKNKILDIEVTSLSQETQNLYENFLKSINYNKDKNVLFREVLFLSIVNEYSRAYPRIMKKEQEITNFEKEYKSHPEWDEEEQ